MNYHSKTNRLTEIFICDLAAERFGAEAYLPSEQRLAEQYQASRNTIRRMLDTLISDGTLLRDENRRVRVNPAQPQKNAASDRLQLNFASYETEFMGDGRKLSFPWRYSFSLNEIMYRYIGFGFILPYEATKQSSSINNCSIIPTESCWARS